MSKTNKKTCPECNGSGFIKTQKIKCNICYINKENCCDADGFIKQPPYKECKVCSSSGEVDL